MVNLSLVPVSEFHRIRDLPIDQYQEASLIADMCRANTLAMVKRAGSGHLGSSFSAMDIVTWLYYQEMNTLKVGLANPNRDIYFSSKGHDVPGLYSVLFSLDVLPREKFLKLRRFGGLDGHPDVNVFGIEANSGSLGMGISKGKGIAWAKRLRGLGGHVFVLTGDGEWQEGQNYEALQSAAQQRLGNLTVIVDHNKVQSDKLVSQIVDLGDLGKKLECFGWQVARCDGHDLRQIEKALAGFRTVTDKPKVLIADTLKGRGVSFMEHPTALNANNGLYPWHAGAPGDEAFQEAYREILFRINSRLHDFGVPPLGLEVVEPEDQTSVPTPVNLVGEPISQAALASSPGGVSDEYVAKAYGQALVEIAAKRKDIIVLDADLASDCRVRDFENLYPERFIENGIAEQDMVSTAGGLARHGLLPVVNSFASFLTARANEQIYNNASEKSKIIYACHYAGLIPAGPGKSHQSLRDISLLGAIPNCILVQPCNAVETRMAVEFCVDEATENCVLRLVIGPSPRIIQLPTDYHLTLGQGVTLAEGQDALLFGYGPVMLHEALRASELLKPESFRLKVVNLPWLNRVDLPWLGEVVQSYQNIFVLEDHSPVGGLGDFLLDALMKQDLLEGRRLYKFGVEGYPACGTPSQALRYHGLDGRSLAKRVRQASKE